MFRLLLRSEEQVQAIAGLGSAFNLMDDVHTNVIAGLAMDDGETIAAWLPEAEVEFGPPAIPSRFRQCRQKPVRRNLRSRRFHVSDSFFDDPDITVIGHRRKTTAQQNTSVSMQLQDSRSCGSTEQDSGKCNQGPGGETG